MAHSSSLREMCGAVNYSTGQGDMRQEIEEILNKILEEASIAMTKERFAELPNEPIAKDVEPFVFQQLAEAFSSIKMEYDDGRIKIIEVRSQGHRAVIYTISVQFGIFLYQNLFLSNTILTGGGLTAMYDFQDGLYLMRNRSVDVDVGLQVLLCRYSVFRVIFEVEIHSRSFSELDQRMKSLLEGWPACLIGVACKFFPRIEDDRGVFEGVVFVYYKRDGVVALEEVVDIGTTGLSAAHQQSLRKISRSIEIRIPENDDRCTIVQNDNKFDTVETSNPDFYGIQLDSDLLYNGTKFEETRNERPALVIDFLQITQSLHRVNGKLFSGAL